jgi:hypothetical protein
MTKYFEPVRFPSAASYSRLLVDTIGCFASVLVPTGCRFWFVLFAVLLTRRVLLFLQGSEFEVAIPPEMKEKIREQVKAAKVTSALMAFDLALSAWCRPALAFGRLCICRAIVGVLVLAVLVVLIS